MKTWSILLAALAIAAFVAGCLGYHAQFLVFILAGCVSYLCYMAHRDEQKFNI